MRPCRGVASRARGNDQSERRDKHHKRGETAHGRESVGVPGYVRVNIDERRPSGLSVDRGVHRIHARIIALKNANP